MDVYAEQILDHYRHPQHKNVLDEPTVSHQEVNAACGDRITLQLRLQDDRVTEVGWQGDGCAVSQAGMSLLAGTLLGQSMQELEMRSKRDIEELLSVPVGPRRTKCALLCLHALRNTLRALKGQEPQAWMETLGE